MSDEGEIHIDDERARAGSTPNIVRWILAISLFAAIVLLSAIWITGAVTNDNSSKAGAGPSAATEAIEEQ